MARIVVGTGLYGKCDQIPNIGYVAHYFFHAGYSPLVPLRSVFVLEKDETEVKLPFSFKAMFFGYLRAFLAWCIGTAALFALFALAGSAQVNLPGGPVALTKGIGHALIGIAVVLMIVFGLSDLVARPSPSRRERLVYHLQQAGIHVS